MLIFSQGWNLELNLDKFFPAPEKLLSQFHFLLWALLLLKIYLQNLYNLSCIKYRQTNHILKFERSRSYVSLYLLGESTHVIQSYRHQPLILQVLNQYDKLGRRQAFLVNYRNHPMLAVSPLPFVLCWLLYLVLVFQNLCCCICMTYSISLHSYEDKWFCWHVPRETV